MSTCTDIMITSWRPCNGRLQCNNRVYFADQLDALIYAWVGFIIDLEPTSLPTFPNGKIIRQGLGPFGYVSLYYDYENRAIIPCMRIDNYHDSCVNMALIKEINCTERRYDVKYFSEEIFCV